MKCSSWAVGPVGHTGQDVIPVPSRSTRPPGALGTSQKTVASATSHYPLTHTRESISPRGRFFDIFDESGDGSLQSLVNENGPVTLPDDDVSEHLDTYMVAW